MVCVPFELPGGPLPPGWLTSLALVSATGPLVLVLVDVELDPVLVVMDLVTDGLPNLLELDGLGGVKVNRSPEVVFLSVLLDDAMLNCASLPETLPIGSGSKAPNLVAELKIMLGSY